MTIQDVISEIRLELTGYILDLEIEDTTIEQVIKKALRELERYYDGTLLVSVPFASCIDLKDSELDLQHKVSSIVNVFRTEAVGGNSQDANALMDPLYAQQFLIFGGAGGTMYNLNDYVLNYASWQTLLQIKNTMSTDMAFVENRSENKLYINHYMDKPARVTIEYIPKLTSVEMIQSDYWIDILIRMSVALTKIVLGRIRTRFTPASSVFTQDGEAMLNEGNTDLKELRETLRLNNNMILPID